MSSVTINREVNATLSSGSPLSATYKFRKRKGLDILGYSIDGTWTGTVVLQSADPGTTDWVTVANGSFTANASGTFVPGNNKDLRFNFSTATSGTPNVRIS